METSVITAVSSRVIGMILLALTLLPTAATGAGQTTLGMNDRGPRFHLASSRSKAPTPVNPRSVPTLRTRLTVAFEDETVATALKSIAEQTGVRFVYSRDIVPADRRVSFSAQDISLAAVLTEVLLGAAVDVVVAPPAQVALVPRSELGGEVMGRVVDPVNQRPIVGARVEIVGDSLETTTDSSGEFRIASVPPGVTALRAAALGYHSFVRSDVIVDTDAPASVVLPLSPSPLALRAIAVAPANSVGARRTQADAEARARPSAFSLNLRDYGGFVGTDVRFGDMADGFAAFVGGHAALLLRRQVYLGVAGAGLVNNPKVPSTGDDATTGPEIDMGYGGFLAGYILPTSQFLELAFDAQIGAGGVTLSEKADRDEEDWDAFFLFEPGARAQLNLSRIARIGFGLGYRFVGGVDTPGLTDSDLRGFTGSATVRLGWF